MSDIAYFYHTYIKGHPVTTDSRHIEDGAVFIALKGNNFDGNNFARPALDAGASCAIVDDPRYREEKGCVVVPDCLKFLQEVAHYHRQQLHIPVLGITGTNGKTTTKELCHAVLSSRFRTIATQGNFNNHIGVPLTLLRMNETTEFGIVEMGANHPGEIKELCEIADPDFGLITNIGQAHLEGFGSYENIIATKNQLFEYVKQKNGKLFVNADDPLLLSLSNDQERITYGCSDSFLKGEIKQSIPYLVYALKTLKGDLYVRTHLIGGYNFDNAMAASCIGCYFGISPLDIQQSIEAYHPSNLRSQLIKTEQNTVILDAYNANPSSMKAALTNFKELPGGDKVVILGEMRELGKHSAEAHRDILDLILPAGFTQILLVGNNFEHTDNKLNFIRYFQNTNELINWLKEHPIVSSCVFVKGSRGNQLERIVEYL